MSTGGQPQTRAQANILNALLIAQVKQDASKAKGELQKLSQEHKKVSTENEKTKKRYADLEKNHKETKKELHQLKLKYDGNYAFENKQIKKETMARVRSAKAQKRKTITAKSKEARQATRIKARTRR